MKSAIQCIALLACVAVCISADAVMLQCRCPKTSKGVKPSLIADATEYKPRPYCNRHEVIVTLKDKTQRCLDPKGKFAKAVLQTMAMMKVKKLTTQHPQQSSSTSSTSSTSRSSRSSRSNRSSRSSFTV